MQSDIPVANGLHRFAASSASARVVVQQVGGIMETRATTPLSVWRRRRSEQTLMGVRMVTRRLPVWVGRPEQRRLRVVGVPSCPRRHRVEAPGSGRGRSGRRTGRVWLLGTEQFRLGTLTLTTRWTHCIRLRRDAVPVLGDVTRGVGSHAVRRGRVGPVHVGGGFGGQRRLGRGATATAVDRGCRGGRAVAVGLRGR